MKHSTALLTPAQSLWRALQTTVRRARPQSQHSLSPSCRRPVSQFSMNRIASQVPRLPPHLDKLSVYTRDEQIKALFVRVKRADGSLGHEETLRTLLRHIDRNAETVVQLSKPGQLDVPVVEIAKIDDLRARIREQEKEARQKALAQRDQKPKQIELNWAISEHDLDLKLKQMESFLAEGRKVELLLAAKKRARRATLDEGEAVLQKIRERLMVIDGKEVAPMEGQVLRQAILMVKAKKAASTGVNDREIGNEDGTEDDKEARRAARRAQAEERKLEEQRRLREEFPDWKPPKEQSVR